ncbi:hypothetical protein [Limimaricola cinnabarinus]|jgi:hypothetical protein|uniref:hypothetical protein n=1 Tax=Limimaricola cinnabarinus TaxID=1125964 RepID=UPI0005ED0EF7|nr:hypothetical protein [Limimaricola cinnabarinus]
MYTVDPLLPWALLGVIALAATTPSIPQDNRQDLPAPQASEGMRLEQMIAASCRASSRTPETCPIAVPVIETPLWAAMH